MSSGCARCAAQGAICHLTIGYAFGASPQACSMNFSTSRVLSLVVVAVAYARAWSIPYGLWVATLVFGPLLAMIWFPEQIDDLTYGSWYRGYQIDSHTPSGAIVALGWLLLMVCASVLFLARFSHK